MLLNHRITERNKELENIKGQMLCNLFILVPQLPHQAIYSQNEKETFMTLSRRIIKIETYMNL